MRQFNKSIQILTFDRISITLLKKNIICFEEINRDREFQCLNVDFIRFIKLLYLYSNLIY